MCTIYTAITSPAGRSSMLKVAERMIMSFCSGVGAAAIHPWSSLPGCADVRIMIRKNDDDPGRPAGIVIGASTSLWLSLPPARVFDFLRAETSRNQVTNVQHYFQCLHKLHR